MTANFEESVSKTHHIKDKWLFVFVYPVFGLLAVHLGNDNSWIQLLGMPSYYTDILFALICVYGCGFFIKWTSLKINKRFGWHEEFFKALKYQSVFGLFLPSLFIVFAELVYLRIIGIHIRESSIFYLEFPLAILLCLLINVAYIFMYYQAFSTAALKQKNRIEKKSLVVREGKSAVNVPINEIAYFAKRNNLTFLVTKSGRDYLYDYPFKSISEKLPPDTFFQLNRQIISSRESVVRCTKMETRRLKVELSPYTDDEVYVAKVNATRFLNWLDRR